MGPLTVKLCLLAKPVIDHTAGEALVSAFVEVSDVTYTVTIAASDKI